MAGPTEYGQVSSYYKGTNAPDEEGVWWAVTDNDDPNTWTVLDYKLFLFGSWRSVRNLFGIAHYGTAAPVNQGLIWAETTTNDPDTWSVIEYHRYTAGAWKSFTELFSAIHVGELPPADLKKIWKKIAADNAFLGMLVYDSKLADWINLFKIKSEFVENSRDFTEADNQVVLKTANNDPATLTLLNAELSLDWMANILTLNEPEVFITAAGGALLNGEVNGTQTLSGQFSSANIQKVRDNEFVITGNLL